MAYSYFVDYLEAFRISLMRQNLKKIVEGLEAAFVMLLCCVFWVFLSPLVLLRWIFALLPAIYHYCKIPQLTFSECIRYEMACKGNQTSRDYDAFEFCYFPRKPFDQNEFFKTESIIQGTTNG